MLQADPPVAPALARAAVGAHHGAAVKLTECQERALLRLPDQWEYRPLHASDRRALKRAKLLEERWEPGYQVRVTHEGKICRDSLAKHRKPKPWPEFDETKWHEDIG